MAFSKGRADITLDDILSRVTESEILSHYLSVDSIPCLIKSPLRVDNNPSFGLYVSTGGRIRYIDFSTKERGTLFDLLGKLWGYNFYDVLLKIKKDMSNSFTSSTTINKSVRRKRSYKNTGIKLECKVRSWENYDIQYWKSYGISIKWLKYANVYPISHKIIIKDGNRYTFKADKYAYVYVEFKEDKTTLKIYQPYNKRGFKWCNNHDGSVISLWTKVPEKGDRLCICSSLKDALCLWENTNIPAIAVQGEGYSISNTAINNLKSRYKKIFVLFDNDTTGIKDGKLLSESTGFTYLELPQFEGGKDISDLYKVLNNKQLFCKTILNLFNYDKTRSLQPD